MKCFKTLWRFCSGCVCLHRWLKTDGWDTWRVWREQYTIANLTKQSRRFRFGRCILQRRASFYSNQSNLQTVPAGVGFWSFCYRTWNRPEYAGRGVVSALEVDWTSTRRWLNSRQLFYSFNWYFSTKICLLWKQHRKCKSGNFKV